MRIWKAKTMDNWRILREMRRSISLQGMGSNKEKQRRIRRIRFNVDCKLRDNPAKKVAQIG